MEGAGVHHNPTGGPADGEWLFGHNWVALAWLAKHPVWGVIALPLRSLLYVRQVNVPKLAEKYGWEFRTKHQLGVELLTWFKQLIRVLGMEVAVVAGGRWGLRGAAVSPPGTRFGVRGGQPLAKGRLPLRLARTTRSSPTRATPHLRQAQDQFGEAVPAGRCEVAIATKASAGIRRRMRGETKGCFDADLDDETKECTLRDLRHCHHTAMNRIEHGTPSGRWISPKFR